MFKSLITKLIVFLSKLFVHETVEQIKESINKPDTVINEDNTSSIKFKLDTNLRNRLCETGDSSTNK